MRRATAGCLTVFFDVAYQSYLPSLVERRQLAEGNSKLEISRSGAQLGGPGLAGALVHVGGNEDRAAGHPAHPRARGEAEEEPRRPLQDAEDGDLERARLQHEDGASGSARNVIWLPNWLIVWAVHSA